MSKKADGGFEITPKIHIEKPVPKSEPIVDTEEEILDLIEVAVEGIAKLTWNNMITMGGLVRAMRVQGVNCVISQITPFQVLFQGAVYNKSS